MKSMLKFLVALYLGLSLVSCSEQASISNSTPTPSDDDVEASDDGDGSAIVELVCDLDIESLVVMCEVDGVVYEARLRESRSAESEEENGGRGKSDEHASDKGKEKRDNR